MKRNLLTLITLSICFIGFAQTFTLSGITYQIICCIDENEVKILDNTNTGDLEIPSTVEYNGTIFNVTEIGQFAFKDNQLTSVVIPNSVNNIEKYAFSFNKLVRINIPINVTVIKENTFTGNQLTSVTISNNVTSIEKGAFSSNQLTDDSITIPNSVTSIGAFAFASNNFTNITIPNSITSIGNSLFRNNKLTNVVIPNNIISIGDYAFSNNQLTSILIPNSVTSIGEYAFEENQLNDLTIPGNVTNIEAFAFRNNQLTNLILEQGITNIKKNAFKNNQLTNITIPNSVSSIERLAFSNNKLTNVTISNGVTSIGEYAFEKNKLNTIIIPESVTNIDKDAFWANPIDIIIMKANTPVIISDNPSESPFSNDHMINVFIPYGTMDAYIDAGWIKFNSIIEIDINNIAIWSGMMGSEWNNNKNWHKNSLPSNNQNIIIPGYLNNFPVIDSGTTVEMNDLFLNRLSSFFIKDKGAVIVNGNLDNRDTIAINSSTTTSGTLIVKGNIAEKDFAFVKRKITLKKKGVQANQWNLISVPIPDITFEDFINNPENDIRVNTSVTPKKYAFGYYNDRKPAGSKWFYYTTNYIHHLNSFKQGKGYVVSKASNGSLRFTGNFESDDIDVDVNADQWNTIGNPYTAYLAINGNSNNNFIQENLSKLDPLYQSVYVWDASQNKYVTTSLSDSDTLLNVGQGFMIKTNTGVSSITFKESHRLPNATTTTLSRKRNRSSIRLIASQDDVQVTTKINYINNTTKGLDPGYDIGNFKGASFDVFTHLVEGNENTDFTIQSLPDSDYETTVIPVGLQSDAGKEISLTVDTDNIPANLNVYLEDTSTGKFIDLTKEKSYRFKTTSKLEGIGRFYLHTSSKILNTENETELTQNVEIVKSGRHEITIQGLVKNKQVTVSLHSILGNEVYKQVAVPQGILTIQPNRLDTGVYIVKVESLQGTITKKVIFK
ncbi:leucine-rich repeat domain-containing protein [uncultured Tenacibaculum sp.]|uniref:leucine-rich repeat domain-containing protein n=1 Tax=uncultured Tenacibaculum sp. TaxID=174713 RepID=UPI00262B5733|nr:leucine-rich repeat domain-containing protein [uncultured Tenacibaculum sp.]